MRKRASFIYYPRRDPAHTPTRLTVMSPDAFGGALAAPRVQNDDRVTGMILRSEDRHEKELYEGHGIPPRAGGPVSHAPEDDHVRETGASGPPRYSRRLSDKILIAFHHAC